MLITRKSPISGNVNTMDLPVTEEQIRDWRDGTLLQRAFPHLSAEEREFISTGITPEEWDAAFGVDED